MASSIPFPDSPPAWLCEELLARAKSAADQNEIPIATGLYKLEEILPSVMEWHSITIQINQTIQNKNPLAHSEILAIESAQQLLKTDYLREFVLVSTLEPCLYCSGAILLSRMSAVYYFAESNKGIRLTDVLNLSLSRKANQNTAGVSNHHPEIYQVENYSQQAKELLSVFFAKQR